MTDTLSKDERERVRRLRDRMNGSKSDYPAGQQARRSKSSDQGDLTAAAEHTGAMIALIPSVMDQKRLAVDGGEPAEELHVTLGYLGEAAMIPFEVQRDIVQCISQCAEKQVSIIANAFAVAMFNPETGEGADLIAGGKEPCVVLLLSGQQLVPFQQYVMQDVSMMFAKAGMEMCPQHAPWVAHLTLVYTGDADLSYFTDRVGPVTFDRVRVAFGGTVVDFPLGMSTALTAASDNWREQPRAPKGSENGGQWTDDPLDTPSNFKIEIASDRENFTFRPDDDTINAVRRLVGKNVDVTVDFGSEYVANGELLGVGTAGDDVSGIKLKHNGAEMFVMWNTVKSISEGKDTDEDSGLESVNDSVHSQAFKDLTKNAVTSSNALQAAPGISEHAPIEQHWALGAYETEGYRAINTALRTGNMKGDVEQNRGEDGFIKTSIRENVKQLDNLMRDSVTNRDILVHRGVRSISDLGVDPDGNLEGLEWSDPAYTSTSTDRGRAVQFARNYGRDSALLNIFVPHGTHAINLGYDEQEILLDRGYHFRVVADRGVVDDVRQLDVEVVPK